MSDVSTDSQFYLFFPLISCVTKKKKDTMNELLLQKVFP